MQFLVRMQSLLPGDFDPEKRARLVREEEARSRELRESGKLLAHWKIPLARESVTLWEVSEPGELHELVMSLPASVWAKATVTALVPRNLERQASDAPDRVA